MITPLVSIMMPVYNEEKSVGYALRSLINQTYDNWECIVVNDGSTDKTLNVIKEIDDSRIHVVNLDSNMGRGYARQVALEKTKGHFLAMLDADDWYYHCNLEKQVSFLISNPSVDLVSTAMVCADDDNNIVGVRAAGNNEIEKFDKFGKVPVPHGSSMFRKKIVGSNKYDIAFKLAQDVDFLRRILFGKKYCLLSDVGYVYKELESVTPYKNIRSYFYNSLGYLKFIRVFPLKSILMFFFENLKIIRVLLYSSVNKFNSLVMSRVVLPEEKHIYEFEQEKKINNI